MQDKQINKRQVDIVLKNDPQSDESISIPFSDILGSLRRFAVCWLAVAVLAALIVAAGTSIFSHQLSSAPVSLIGFDYPGASQGLAPDGTKFDVNSIKNPAVIETALTTLDYPMSYVDSVRNAIVIEGVVPSDAIDQITAYKNVFEKSGNIEAAKRMLDVSYNYTKYKVTFDFSKTPFGDDEAALVINTVLECYSDYFYEQYGDSQAVGNAALAVDYTDYDYLIAVDRYISTLETLQEAVDGFRSTDFRSTETGFTFADLSSAVRNAKAYDADTLTAYIIDKSVVADKAGLQSYYEYQLSELELQQKSAVSNLNAIKESIEAYEKDQIIVYGELQEETAASYSTVSEEYDSLFSQLQQAQREVSNCNYRIDSCKTRLAAVKKLGASGTDAEDAAYVEERIAVLDETVNELTTAVNATLREYNESITFANSYAVLVPANVLSTSYVSMLLSNIMKPLLLVEAGVFFVYAMASVVHGFVTDSRRRKAQAAEE